jgi:hypothetical protein
VPNIAARVQAAAEPDTIAITDATHRLVSGLFVVEDRGAQELKGIERPLQLYRVVRPSGMRGRFPAMAAMRGMTPFVGREDELRRLVSRWERALDGEGQKPLLLQRALQLCKTYGLRDGLYPSRSASFISCTAPVKSPLSRRAMPRL